MSTLFCILRKVFFVWHDVCIGRTNWCTVRHIYIYKTYINAFSLPLGWPNVFPSSIVCPTEQGKIIASPRTHVYWKPDTRLDAVLTFLSSVLNCKCTWVSSWWNDRNDFAWVFLHLIRGLVYLLSPPRRHRGFGELLYVVLGRYGSDRSPFLLFQRMLFTSTIPWLRSWCLRKKQRVLKTFVEIIIYTRCCCCWWFRISLPL
jgi:hypothetical protein